jgi:hypothetical protein
VFNHKIGATAWCDACTGAITVAERLPVLTFPSFHVAVQYIVLISREGSL